MRTTALLAGFSIFLASTTASMAQSQDVDAVKSANQAFYKAFSAKDTKAMEDLWANKPYVMYYDPRAKSTSVGYDNVIETWNGLFDRLAKIDITVSSVDIKTDGKIAWVVASETASIQRKGGGDSQKINTIATNVFEKQRDRWLLISHQAQMLSE